ncbi:MAG: MFS transporter [Candidatus Heimdallarchaeota archaeon]|nr:MFS transporter [Candidatus Heimdallarchaeota archaeon]
MTLPQDELSPPLEEQKNENKMETKEDKTTIFPHQLLVLMFLITGLFTTASFIANAFMGLYAVIIGATASALSLITSLRNLIQLAVQSTFGRISDKIGRKLLIFLGLLGSGIFVALFPLIKNGWLLVGAVSLYSIGVASYVPAFTALQGDISNKENRAGLISLITIVGALASMVGLVAVGFASNLGDSEWLQYTIILEIAAGIFIIGSFVSLLVTDPPVERITKRQKFTLKPVIKNKSFRKFVIINSLMGFSMSLGWPIFPFVRGEYATAQQNTWIWAIFAFFQIVSILITRPFINKISRKKLLIFGRIIMFYVPLNLALTVLFFPYWWHLAICNMTSGLSVALYMVGQNSYILDCAPEKEKGTFTGIHNFFMGIATFLGSLIMGIIADILIIRFDKWPSIVVLLFVITGARLISALGFFFLQKPAIQVEKTEVAIEPPPEVTLGGTK